MNQTETPNSTAPSPSSTGPRRQRQPHQHQRDRQQRRRGGNQRYQVSISAGGIIYRRAGRQPEVFFVKNAYGRWTFPKGKQNLGESLVETAIREIREEVGLTNLRFIAPLGRTTFRFRREGTLIQKTVYFFLFEAPADAKEVMTGQEAMWEATWVPTYKAIEINGYQNLDRLLLKGVRLISQQDRRKPLK